MAKLKNRLNFLLAGLFAFFNVSVHAQEEEQPKAGGE